MKTAEEIKKLIDSHKKLIDLEASKHAKFIPITFVKMEAYKLAHKAALNYNASTGIKFSTYLTNALQKLSRLSTQYGGTVRVPENKQFKISKLNQVETGLTETYGRQPTAAELSDATGMSVTAVNSLLSARKKDVNLSNLAYTPTFHAGNDDEWVHFVYHDLGDKDKLIFEYKVGFAGKATLDNAAIAKKLQMSPSTVSQRLKFITARLGEGME
jgi:DNA-directed RNA polymerase specialized sigma subunit